MCHIKLGWVVPWRAKKMFSFFVLTIPGNTCDVSRKLNILYESGN